MKETAMRAMMRGWFVSAWKRLKEEANERPQTLLRQVKPMT
jgi:hypothetical protein